MHLKKLSAANNYQTFQAKFSIEANSADPDQIAPIGAVIIFHFEGMSFSSAHDLKQWDFLDNNEIFSEFAQFIRQHTLTILTIKQLVVKRPSLTRCAQT